MHAQLCLDENYPKKGDFELHRAAAKACPEPSSSRIAWCHPALIAFILVCPIDGTPCLHRLLHRAPGAPLKRRLKIERGVKTVVRALALATTPRPTIRKVLAGATASL
eukprot:scaffold43807_cov42-Phaeocystis_antarctica.AAC.1